MTFFQKLRIRLGYRPQIAINSIILPTPWVMIVNFRFYPTSKESYYYILQGEFKSIRREFLKQEETTDFTTFLRNNYKGHADALSDSLYQSVFNWKTKY